jgi:hypothetical protein
MSNGTKSNLTPDTKEWPVSDADLDAICDAALDEPAMLLPNPDDRFVVGGSDPETGFALSAARMRKRTAQMAAGVPSIQNVLSARRKKAFLMALSQSGNVSMACAAAGWGRGVAYSIRKADKDFAEKWEYALETATDILHAAAFQRAVHGVQEDVWHKGKEGAEVVGQVTKFDSQLTMFLLKAHDRSKYGDKIDTRHEATKGGVLVVPGVVPLEQWSAAAALQQAQYREERTIDDS